METLKVWDYDNRIVKEKGDVYISLDNLEDYLIKMGAKSFLLARLVPINGLDSEWDPIGKLSWNIEELKKDPVHFNFKGTFGVYYSKKEDYYLRCITRGWKDKKHLFAIEPSLLPIPEEHKREIFSMLCLSEKTKDDWSEDYQLYSPKFIKVFKDLISRFWHVSDSNPQPLRGGRTGTKPSLEFYDRVNK